MKYTQYGTTGKTVSILGFGGMRFDMDRPQSENIELVTYAHEKGITYFDTAPGYCNNQSEVIMGKALRRLQGEWYVTTKGMPEAFDTAQKARDAVRTSLDRMGLDKIHFYHVWCLRNMSQYELAMKPGGQYEGLLRCKEEGLIDHIVFSSHQPGPEVKQIIESGHFEGVLLGANILNFPYRWDGVQAAHDAGLGVVAMNPLAGGAIPEHADELGFLCQDGETPTEAALRFVMGCPQYTVALNGFTTREHIDTACAVADRAAPLPTEEIETIRQSVTDGMDAICTSCGYCKGCPSAIPIPMFMQVYNEKIMFNRSDEDMARKLAEHHFKWGMLVGREGKAATCIECGACQEKCTQHLPIMDRLKEMARWEETGVALSDAPESEA